MLFGINNIVFTLSVQWSWSPWVFVAHWMECPPGVQGGHGLNSCLGLRFLFLFACSCHVDQFTFHILLTSLQFTIFIHLPWPWEVLEALWIQTKRATILTFLRNEQGAQSVQTGSKRKLHSIWFESILDLGRRNNYFQTRVMQVT